MGKKIEGESTRIHFWISTSDKVRLKKYFSHIGLSDAVRVIIHSYLNRLDDKLESQSPLPTPDIDI